MPSAKVLSNCLSKNGSNVSLFRKNFSPKSKIRQDRRLETTVNVFLGRLKEDDILTLSSEIEYSARNEAGNEAPFQYRTRIPVFYESD